MPNLANRSRAERAKKNEATEKRKIKVVEL